VWLNGDIERCTQRGVEGLHYMHRLLLRAPRCAVEGTAGVRRREWKVRASRERDGALEEGATARRCHTHKPRQ
jgi:hypothetical protein